MERRFSSGKVDVKGQKIVGLASPVYDGTPGTQYQLWPGTFERFAPGAFSKHLATDPDVVATYNHQAAQVLGRKHGGTLELRYDSRGLHYEASPAETSYVADLRANIAAGNLGGSSFTFHPERVEWQRDGGSEIRLITEAKIFEVAAVVSPAYGGSSVGVRSEERAALEQEKVDYFARLETEKRLARMEQLRADKPYGDVPYADAKNGKYPIDTEAHIRAAWSYINMPKNQKGYTPAEVASIKAKIVSAWKKKIDPKGPPSA